MSTAKLKDYASLVALPHSVFALPYALASFLIAASLSSTPPAPHHPVVAILLISMAVVAARTAAMAFNRLVDADIDTANPRTSSRELPRGALSQKQVRILVTLSSLVFLGCAALLGAHCLLLAPLVLLVLLGYSYTKRYTNFSHLVLGLALALAPGGAWWVLRPQIELIPVVLMLSVLFWVAGFDVLYSCQDEEFDRSHGVFSIPARFGLAKALRFAQSFHIVAFIGFLLVGVAAGFDSRYFVGTLALGTLLIGQHLLISPNNMSRVNHSFFTFNGLISIGYFLLILLTT